MPVSEIQSVKVWKTSEDYEIGALSYGPEDVFVRLASGRVIAGQSSEGVRVSLQDKVTLDDNGRSVVEPIGFEVKAVLKPVLMIFHPYTNQGGQILEDVFPPSTSGFYGRLQAGSTDALYVVHKIENSERFWLTIINPQRGTIYESCLIQPYEAEALSLFEDHRAFHALSRSSSIDRERIRHEILSVLDGPPPSWQELSRVLGDVTIPDLNVRTTMRSTLEKIVPTSFPGTIREELMAFLAYAMKSRIPDDDPLMYSFKFSTMTIIDELLRGHVMNQIDGTEWPPYVKLMILAAKGQLDAPKKAVSDSISNVSWLLFCQKCAELLPNWLKLAVQSARALNDSGRIALGLPTTRGAAKRSRMARKRRFAEISYGIRVGGYISPASLGLCELVYLGAAYRWAHRHMKFIAQLGGVLENSPHLHVMIAPLRAAERIRRAIPSIMNVAWTFRTSNMNIFDDETSSWLVPGQQIIESIEKESSLRSLKKQFGGASTTDMYSLSKIEAEVADLVAEGIELAYLEKPEYLSSLKLTKRRMHATLSALLRHRILHFSYEVSDSRLISLATIIQGECASVTSLVSAFLRSTPTSYARLDQHGENAIILSRLPEESVYSIASQLPSRGMEQGLNIRCMRPTTFRRYTSNLYQRLLREDGTWDDDVSAFLSQARSRRRELSESNA